MGVKNRSKFMMKVPTGPYSGLLAKMTLVHSHGCFKREISGTSRHISPAAIEGMRPDEPESDMPRAYLAERIQKTRVAGANYLLGTPGRPSKLLGGFAWFFLPPVFSSIQACLTEKSPQPKQKHGTEGWVKRRQVLCTNLRRAHLGVKRAYP